MSAEFGPDFLWRLPFTQEQHSRRISTRLQHRNLWSVQVRGGAADRGRTSRITSVREIMCFCLQHINIKNSLDIFPSVFYVNGSAFSSWDVCILLAVFKFCFRHVLKTSSKRLLAVNPQEDLLLLSHIASSGLSADFLLGGHQKDIYLNTSSPSRGTTFSWQTTVKSKHS